MFPASHWQFTRSHWIQHSPTVSNQKHVLHDFQICFFQIRFGSQYMWWCDLRSLPSNVIVVKLHRVTQLATVRSSMLGRAPPTKSIQIIRHNFQILSNNHAIYAILPQHHDTKTCPSHANIPSCHPTHMVPSRRCMWATNMFLAVVAALWSKPNGSRAEHIEHMAFYKSPCGKFL